MRRRRGLQQSDAFRRTDFRVNRGPDGGFGKDAQERCVRAANAIASINCRDRADHAFQHLIAELALPARGFGAPPGLMKAPLHLPDGGHGHCQTCEQREQIPDPNRSRGRLLHLFGAGKDLFLLDRRILDFLIQFDVDVTELCKTLSRVSLFVFRNLEIGGEIVTQLLPLWVISELRAIQ